MFTLYLTYTDIYIYSTYDIYRYIEHDSQHITHTQSVPALLRELAHEHSAAMNNIDSPEEMVKVISRILKRQNALLEV